VLLAPEFVSEGSNLLIQLSRNIAAILTCVLFACSANPARAGDFSTLYGKHVVGYQGWFSCPSDPDGLGWRHWFRGKEPDAKDLVVDMWPDTSELTPPELCATGLSLPSGKPAYLFSSEDPKTVARHFLWMRNNNIDGVALERFVSEFRVPETLEHTNLVTNNVRAAAEREGRGFFIMYDLSGDIPDIVGKVSRDWNVLTQSNSLTDSPSYMRHRSKPLVGLWGLGLRPISPAEALALIRFFRTASTPATIIAGVPAYWRTLGKDSRKELAWAQVFRSVDVLSPWTVGRYKSEAEFDEFKKTQVSLDIMETKRLGIDYLPVAFPGMSWHNGTGGRTPLGHISRDCGQFYKHQVDGMVKAGATMLYTAMFDEVNEGTAIFKVAATPDEQPSDAPLLSLDTSDCHVHSDWYLRLAGAATLAIRHGR
jgi:hypothetical protein